MADSVKFELGFRGGGSVAGEASATSPLPEPNAATASRMASRAEIASINGGSPTALLP